MILSNTIYEDKNYVATDAIDTLTKVRVGVKFLDRGVYNEKKVNALTSFLKSSLCEYKTIAIVALLLIFQFSLYDYNINEYISSDHHGPKKVQLKGL